MTTIETTTINNETYTIQFNGSATYFVIDSTDTAIFRCSTLRKAKNFLNKVQG
jgi:putative heme iron utilization protein